MRYSNTYTPDCWYREVCENYTEGCVRGCIRYAKMRYMMENSNIPIAKRVPIKLTPSKVDIEAFRKLSTIKDDIYNFVYDGKSLYISSKIVGNGKTSFSLKILMHYFETCLEDELDVRGVFVHVPTFLIKLKDFNNIDEQFEELKRLLLGVDLVVWDDIASTDMSAYDISQLTSYIDARVMNELSNIYTGNITSREQMQEVLGARLTSRIWNSKTEIVEFFGGERR